MGGVGERPRHHGVARDQSGGGPLRGGAVWEGEVQGGIVRLGAAHDLNHKD
jgi:hypothetical protein